MLGLLITYSKYSNRTVYHCNDTVSCSNAVSTFNETRHHITSVRSAACLANVINKLIGDGKRYTILD